MNILQDVVNAIVNECAEFYSYAFPGSTALIFDFIFAANSIISTQNLKVCNEIASEFCLYNGVQK